MAGGRATRLCALRDHLSSGEQHRLSAGLSAAAAAADVQQPGAMAPGLPADEIAHFKEHGFVVAKGLLRESDFDDLIGAYNALITERAKPLLEAGLLSSLHEELGFDTRLAALRNDPLLPAERRGDLTTQIDMYEARLPQMFEFFFNERLLAGVASLIGPEITLSPIQHIRPFTSGGAGPQWHMDQAVTLEEADVSEIVTAWIPFVDTYPENGCLQFVSGIAPDESWRKNRDAHMTIGHHESPHVHIKDRAKQKLEVPEAFLERLGKTKDDVEVVEAVMQKGDVLLFNAYVPHRGGTNSSPKSVRWSMDLRFQRNGSPTGRPHWPEFVLQSPSSPASVQDKYEEWRDRWIEGLASPAKDLHRQPPSDTPLQPGDRVKIGESDAVAVVVEVQVAPPEGWTDVPKLSSQSVEPRYLLETMATSGGGSNEGLNKTGEWVICSRDQFELF